MIPLHSDSPSCWHESGSRTPTERPINAAVSPTHRRRAADEVSPCGASAGIRPPCDAEIPTYPGRKKCSHAEKTLTSYRRRPKPAELAGRAGTDGRYTEE